MRSPRRSFTPEFRTLAVSLVDSGKSLTIVARELNISPQLLRSWVLKLNKSPKLCTADASLMSQENELTLLKKENAQLRRENESIKNAAFYISKDQPHQQSARSHRSGVNKGVSFPNILTTVFSEYHDQVQGSHSAIMPQDGTDSRYNKSTIHTCIARYYMRLSKLHKKAADFVLSNILRTATMSIDEFAIATGISIATAHRFAQVLGFDGYPKFRAEVVKTLDAMLTPTGNRQTQRKRTKKSYDALPGSINEYLNNIALRVS